MPTSSFATHITELRELGGQRVWSLMVSLFGDLAQAPGETIDGPVLSAIMQVLQVKPEAVRVALHRLRNDGWIESQKSGRISRHSLTAKGRRESVAASPRIYARPDGNSAPWQLAILEEANADSLAEMNARGFSAIGPRLFVGPRTSEALPGSLTFAGEEAPDWLRAQLLPEDLRASYQALCMTLERLSGDLADAEDLPPIQVAALRCLIVHNWRRLVLKHPPLPLALVPSDWPGHLCHQRVADLLDRYPRPDLAEIERRRAA